MNGRHPATKRRSGHRVPAALYAFLMYLKRNPHRFLTFVALPARPNRNRPEREEAMLDILMLALGAGLFIITVGYAYACERL
jgi:hypothetical protein